MILRAATLAAGLAGGAGLSQFPEYSQQYMQRLGGAVDELERVVADFDASAAASGLTRDAALAELQGTDFLERRRADMTRTIERAETLAEDLALLETAGPFTRAYYAARFTDGEVARAALDVYRPAVPVTFEGAIFAVAGFLLGSAALGGLLAILRGLFRRKPATA